MLVSGVLGIIPNSVFTKHTHTHTLKQLNNPPPPPPQKKTTTQSDNAESKHIQNKNPPNNKSNKIQTTSHTLYNSITN